MFLKGRLKAIAGQVTACGTIFDIGTDHAYIPIYLAASGSCNNAVASDIQAGPLLAAQKNIEKYGLSDHVKTFQGDGLEPFEVKGSDIIIISGMGGMLIAEILEKGKEKAKNAYKLILQPMKDIEAVREWLFWNCFEITDEELAGEGGKIYVIIAAKWTGKRSGYENIDLFAGKKLIEKRDPLLAEYLSNQIKKLDKIINGLKRSKNREKDILINNQVKEQIRSVLDDLSRKESPDVRQKL